MSPPQTAGETFRDLALSAELHLRPPGRGAAIAATLRQVGTWVEDSTLTQADLHHALTAVAEGYAALTSPTPQQISRATTVRELSALVHPTTEVTEAGLQRALTVWVQVAVVAADSTDGRLTTISSTWERESEYLAAAIRDRICAKKERFDPN